MKFDELARRQSKLSRILMGQDAADNKANGIREIAFEFEGQHHYVYSVNIDTDEMKLVKRQSQGIKFFDASAKFPFIKKAYGLCLIWYWEMKNHQGYFDALQIELTDTTLRDSMVLQFKVIASSIKVFEVYEKTSLRSK